MIDLVYWFLMVDATTVGCRSTLFAATTNARLLGMEKVHGQYIIPDANIREPAPIAKDEQMASRLWELSLDILQEKLGHLDYGFERTNE